MTMHSDPCGKPPEWPWRCRSSARERKTPAVRAVLWRRPKRYSQQRIRAPPLEFQTKVQQHLVQAGGKGSRVDEDMGVARWAIGVTGLEAVLRTAGCVGIEMDMSSTSCGCESASTGTGGDASRLTSGDGRAPAGYSADLPRHSFLTSDHRPALPTTRA